VYHDLARVDEADGKRAAAIDTLRRGVARRPGSALLLFPLAELLIETGKAEDADRVVSDIERWKLQPERVVLLRGRVKMATGDWVAARAVLEAGRPTLTTASPALAAEADVLLGRCHERLGQDDLALTAFRRAAGGSDRSDAPLLVARALTRLGRLGEAVEQYRQLSTAPTASDETLVRYGQLLTLRYLASPPASRQATDVEGTLREIYDRLRLPRGGQLVLLTAQLRIADGKWAEAEDILRGSLKREPDAAPVAVTLASLLDRRGDQDEAWRVLSNFADRPRHPEATGERPPSEVISLHLAKLSLLHSADHPQAGPTAQAAERYLTELDGAEDRLLLVIGLAEWHSRLKNWGEARRWWGEAARLRKDDLATRFRLFDLAVQTDDRTQMEAEVREIHRIEGGAGAFGHYAEALLRLSRFKDHSPAGMTEAWQHLKAAGLLRPTWAAVPFTRGRLFELEGKADEALVEYMRAIDLGEQRQETIRPAVQLLCKRGRYQEADRLLQRVRTAGQESQLINRLAAEVSLHNQEPERAIEFAAAAVASGSQESEELQWQGTVLAQAGKTDEATAAFRRAIDTSSGLNGSPWVALVWHHVRFGQAAKADEVFNELQAKLTGPLRAYTSAQCLEAMGRAGEAEKLYVAEVAARPADLTAVRNLASFYQRSGAPRKSVPALRAVLTAPAKLPAPEDRAWVHRSLAAGLTDGGDYPSFREALSLLEQNVAAGTDVRVDQISRARALATRVSHRREAVEALQKLVPLDAEDEFLLGQLRADTGSWSDGRKAMTNALARLGDDPGRVQFLIDRLLRNGEVGDAEVWLDRLERTAAADPATIRLRATAAVKDGQEKEAVARIRKWVADAKLEPDVSRDRVRQAAAMAESTSPDPHDQDGPLRRLADELYRQASDSGGVEDRLALARYHGRRGRVADALAGCRKIDAGNDSLAVAVALVTIAYTATAVTESHLEEIDRDLADRLRQARPSRGSDSLSAAFHARRGRYTQAAEAFRAALRSGREAETLNNLAYMLLLSNGRPDEIDSLLTAAFELAGPAADLLDTRGMAHLTAGRSAAAVADLERAVGQAPKAARYLHLALAYEQAGKQKEAVAALDHARSLRADGSFAIPIELAKLEELAGRLNRDR
jgi:cellulose synthase operon protein C